MDPLEKHHCIAVARELTAAAGFPMRDRWGFAASDATVQFILELLFREPDDEKAGDVIFFQQGQEIPGTENVFQIADRYEMATEEYEQGIISALRPLVEDRRKVAARALR